MLQNTTSGSCTGLPHNTHTGSGTGTINGESGATVQWTFVDGGQPGVWTDSGQIVIKNAAGEPAIEISGRIYAGNHIASR